MAKDTTNWELPRISMNYLNHQSTGKLTIKHGIYVMGISKWLVDSNYEIFPLMRDERSR